MSPSLLVPAEKLDEGAFACLEGCCCVFVGVSPLLLVFAKICDERANLTCLGGRGRVFVGVSPFLLVPAKKFNGLLYEV